MKQSLMMAARSARRVQVRTYARPKIVYGNDPGISILGSIEAVRGEMRGLRERAEAHKRGCEEKIRKLEADTRALTEEVVMLQPLKAMAVDIRKRFFCHVSSREGISSSG